MYKFLVICIFIISSVEAHDSEFVGQFTFGNEVSIFKACNSEKIYWLEGSGFLMADLETLMLQDPKPYTTFLLKFRGHEHFEEVDGYQADYKYQMHLSEIIEFNKNVPHDCK